MRLVICYKGIDVIMKLTFQIIKMMALFYQGLWYPCQVFDLHMIFTTAMPSEYYWLRYAHEEPEAKRR